MRTAKHDRTTPVPLPERPQARVIPNILMPRELIALLAIGDHLANISARRCHGNRSEVTKVRMAGSFRPQQSLSAMQGSPRLGTSGACGGRQGGAER